MGADYIRTKTAKWKLFGYPLEFTIYIDGEDTHGKLTDYYGVFGKKFTGKNNAELKAAVSSFADRMKKYSLRFESGLIYMFEDKEETARLKRDVSELFANLNKRVFEEQKESQKNTSTKQKVKKAVVYEIKKAASKHKAKQTGSSNKKADAQRKAKAPGKRTSASGKAYTERRKNRSDKPGSKL